MNVFNSNDNNAFEEGLIIEPRTTVFQQSTHDSITKAMGRGRHKALPAWMTQGKTMNENNNCVSMAIHRIHLL